MPARNVARPGDLTGRNKAALAKEHAEELAAREKEISLMNAAAAAEKSDTVVEVKPKQPEPVVDTVVEVADAVEVETPVREFRVNTAIENMTFGHGQHYDFEEGVRYKAPKALYDHLDSLGYIWH
jgi:phage-related tail protein